MLRFPILAAILCLGLPAAAQTLPDAARAEAEAIGQTVDADRDGTITPDELRRFGDRVFATLDTDRDGMLGMPEMVAPRFGLRDIADYRSRRQGYDTAIAIVFDIFDRDNDQVISMVEHRGAMAVAFALADANRDGILGMDEYLDGFIFNIAVRNALS